MKLKDIFYEVLKEADEPNEPELYPDDDHYQYFNKSPVIDFLKSNPEINKKLKQRYQGYYQGMIDGIGSYYSHQHPKNPFKDIKDPLEYLNAYMGSKEEKEDADEMFKMSLQDNPQSKIDPPPPLPKVKL